jgi:predicted transcriptional regulator
MNAVTTAPMSLKLPSDTKERLKTLALLKKRPAHALAREAVEAYIAHEEVQVRRNREAEAAWQHYQETGLHATGEEVMAWVASWGTTNQLPPPECHS